MKKIAQIQVARAIAALMVVYYHSYMALRAFDDASAVPLPFLAESGYLGVNLFFIISGFIIGLVTDAPKFRARDFLVKRVFRIYPVFWAFLAGQLLLTRTEHTIFTRAPASGLELLQNIVLWPLPGEPAFAVAWSLEHEMLFYLLALIVVPFAKTAGLFGVVALLGVSGQFAGPGWDHHLLSAHQLEFAAGLGLYLCRAKVARLGVALPAVVAAAAYALTVHQIVPHVGVLAGTVLLAALLNLPDAFVERRLGFMTRMGDASYSLYLGHWLLAGVAAQFAWGLRLPGWFAEPYRAVLIAASVVSSLVVYRWLEAPVIALGHRLAGGSRSGSRAGAQDAPRAAGGALATLLAFVMAFSVLAMLGRMQYLGVLSAPAERDAASAIELLDAVAAARDGSRAAPAKVWGAMTVNAGKDRTVVDVERVSRADCVNALLRADALPGLVTAAGSMRGADERSVPVAEHDAKATCRRSRDNAMRFIFAEALPARSR